MSATADREFDVVLLGATGFTGTLTAQYLAEHAPDDLRWALAGRNPGRLAEVRAGLGKRWAKLPLLHADAGDPESLAALAASTRVVASTVGPYLVHGEALVGACAAAGTDYVDLTGEPEFVDRMFLAHDATARATGARLVHSCGFDSVPHDLGVQFLLEPHAGAQEVEVRGVVRTSGSFSGGTFDSALTAFGRAKQMKAAAGERRDADPRPEGRSVRGVAGRPHKDDVLGYWLVPLPTIDPQVVLRSAAALPEYGTRFRYSHWAGTKTLRYAVGGMGAVGAIALAAQFPPLREQLRARVPAGSGPDEARRARSRFSVDLVGTVDGAPVRARVSGGDPGYDETAKMLAESAMCLALDDLPPTAGQVTPAVAMGAALRERLVSAGMRFERL